jgi:hypothetical protein
MLKWMLIAILALCFQRESNINRLSAGPKGTHDNRPIAVGYGAGLRAASLKMGDIDGKRTSIRVARDKVRKDKREHRERHQAVRVLRCRACQVFDGGSRKGNASRLMNSNVARSRAALRSDRKQYIVMR